MTLSPRTVALLAFLAFVPLAAYGIESGEFTTIIAVMGVLNVLIIGTSIMVLFGGKSGSASASEAIP